MNIEGLAGGAAPVTTKSGTSCHTAVKSLEYIFDKVSETMIASIDPDADGKQSFSFAFEDDDYRVEGEGWVDMESEPTGDGYVTPTMYVVKGCSRLNELTITYCDEDENIQSMNEDEVECFRKMLDEILADFVND